MKRFLFSLALFMSISSSAFGADFVTLFDGKTLDGWELINSQPGVWIVRDGLLVTTGKGGGWLSTKKTYKNFVFRVEFMTHKGGNSGVFIRSPRMGDPAYTGMEIQVLDDDADTYKSLKPYQYTGSVYGVIAAKRGSVKPVGEWNTMEITAEGPHIVVKVNGTTITDGRLDEHKDAEQAHPGILRHDGYLGLQSHSDEVFFRNIKVKELD